MMLEYGSKNESICKKMSQAVMLPMSVDVHARRTAKGVVLALCVRLNVTADPCEWCYTKRWQPRWDVDKWLYEMADRVGSSYAARAWQSLERGVIDGVACHGPDWRDALRVEQVFDAMEWDWDEVPCEVEDEVVEHLHGLLMQFWWTRIQRMEKKGLPCPAPPLDQK